MHVISGRNVNSIYKLGMEYILSAGKGQDSRNGPVYVVPTPVTVVYEHPTERVLLNRKRDANPFFHVIEALWMLAGRNDVALLERYVKRMRTFAEDDGSLHGAYGYRWRNHFDMEGGGNQNLPDQLATVIRMLRNNPLDRRAVLSMWDPVADLARDFRDVPCNLLVLPRIVNGRLDITVMNRSNDFIWGLAGANAVHFSVLQEYMAAMIGVSVGTYYQVSTNMHAYVDEFEKRFPPSEEDRVNPYVETAVIPVEPRPLVDDPITFDAEVEHLLNLIGTEQFEQHPYMYNKFLSQTVFPMFKAHNLFKQGKGAYNVAADIEASDWRRATREWLDRRLEQSLAQEIT